MERKGWDFWNGKHVFIRLKNGRVYSGDIIDIDFDAKPLIFITIIDKFGSRIMFSQSEIDVMKEEEVR